MGDRIEFVRPWGDIAWSAVLTSMVIGVSALAVSSLARGIAIVASIIWLLFVIAMLGARIGEEGWQVLRINRRGELSSCHCAELVCPEDAPARVEFGFRCLGLHRVYETIQLAKIESVTWGPGQATSLAGHDMKDWSVVVWYDHDDPSKSERQKRWHVKPDQDLHIFGPARAKEETAELGHRLLALLASAGAKLVEGNDDRTYVRGPRDKTEGS